MGAPKEFDQRRAKFIELRSKGVSRKESAIMAGYSDADKSGDHVEDGQIVTAELARIRAEAAANVGMTKEMVAHGFIEAATMAKLNSDAVGMVSAWRELGKLLGFYAPEVRKIEKGINKKELKAALEDLSDDELRQLSRGRVIDGKFTRVEEAGAPANTDVPRLQAQPA